MAARRDADRGRRGALHHRGGPARRHSRATGAYCFPAGLIWLLAAAYTFFGSSAAVTRTVTIALSALAVPFVVYLTREISDDARAPRIAGWMAALYPVSILSAGNPTSQSLGYPTLVAAAFLLISAWRTLSTGRAALGGLALGAFALSRSSAPSIVAVLLGLALVLRVAIAHPTYHYVVLPLLMPFAALALSRLAEGRTAFHALATSRAAWIALAVFAAVQIEYGYFALLYR